MDLYALVIDADAHERRSLSDLLKSHDWQVVEASTPADAAGRLGERPWALVFCDAELAAQSVDAVQGRTLLGELKGRGSAAAHVVITAAPGRPVRALEAILNGAADYLRKPLAAAEVIACARGVTARLCADRQGTGRRTEGRRARHWRRHTCHARTRGRIGSDAGSL